VDVTPVLTSTPQDQWDGAQREADQLGLDTELEEKVTVVVLEAKHWQQEWRARREAPPPVTEETPPLTQEAVLDMAEVERVVVPAGEGRAVSSDALLVVSSTRKVSSRHRCLCLQLTTRLSRGEWEEEEEDKEVDTAAVPKKKVAPVSSWQPKCMGAVNACKACKRAGVADECEPRMGSACARCNRLKVGCSLAQGRRGPRKQAETLVVVVVPKGTRIPITSIS